MAFGEDLSTQLFAWLLRGKGKEVQLQWAGDFIETDSRFGSAVVDLEASYTKLQQYLNGQNDFNSDQVPR